MKNIAVNAISLFLYNISIRLYAFVIWMASPFNRKAALWISGRKRQIPVLEKRSGTKTIWFHCASLGEFEQARPVIERLKRNYPPYFVVLTFFSPSGFEVRKNYQGVDAVLYLPLDTASNARRFIQRIKPDVALFAKYEFWYHYLHVLKQHKVPVILFSSVFRADHVFFKWYGGFFRSMLKMFTRVFVQNESSRQLLETISVPATVAFDTRFDRVLEIAQRRESFAAIEKFCAGSKIFLAGSTWPKDEELVRRCIHEDLLREYKYIIAPHNLSGEGITGLISSIKVKARRLSEMNVENAAETDVIVVDTMGQLAQLYAYAHISYVGGGFDTSVHNVLEPAVYGMPVLFGPNHTKSVEAMELAEMHGAFTVNDYNSLKNTLLGLIADDSKILNEASEITRRYVQERKGGAQVVVAEVEALLQ